MPTISTELRRLGQAPLSRRTWFVGRGASPSPNCAAQCAPSDSRSTRPCVEVILARQEDP